MPKMWSPVISSSHIVENDGPKKRCKHAVCLHMENVYMYGGKQGYRALKDFWKYDLVNKTWTNIHSNGEHPPALQQHTMVTNGEKIYVFGGELCVSSASGTPIWIYDIHQEFWYKCSSKSESHGAKFSEHKNTILNKINNNNYNNKINNDHSPSGRRGHSAVLIPRSCDNVTLDIHRSKMIVFGGFMEPHGSTDELYSFDIEKETWHLLKPSENIPPARHSHSAVLHGGYMWIYGGMTNLNERNDFWKYDIMNNQWESINSGQGPGYLHSHTAVVLNDEMIIFGGETKGSLSNDIWKFSFQNGGWEKLYSDIKPSPCSQLAAIAVPAYQIVESNIHNVEQDTRIKDIDQSCSEFYNNSFTEHNPNNVYSRKDFHMHDTDDSISNTSSCSPLSSLSSSLNNSFRKSIRGKKSRVSDDKRILINPMDGLDEDNSLCDITDRDFEFSNLDCNSTKKSDRKLTYNECSQDMTLLDIYDDDNGNENKTNFMLIPTKFTYNHGFRNKSYNEKVNESYTYNENTFEMQDFSNNKASNNNYIPEINIYDSDTVFACKTISFSNAAYQYKSNKQQYDSEKPKSSLKDLMYIFCGKEESQSSQITEPLIIWELALH